VHYDQEEAQQEGGGEEEEEEGDEFAVANPSLADGESTEEVYDVDAAIALALAPLEKYQHSKEMDKRLSAERDRSASQYAVGAAAIAAMRTGFKRRHNPSSNMVAAEIATFECALEEAVVKRKGHRVASAEFDITETYGEIVSEEMEGDEGGVFGRGGTLQMVLGMLNKGDDEDDEKSTEDGSDDVEGEEEEEEEEADSSMTAELLMKREVERNLWRRCLQAERLRSAALLRRLTTLQRGKEQQGRQLAIAHENIVQLSHVRDSLTNQHNAQSERLALQREAIARLGRFQRMCEVSDERARMLNERMNQLAEEKDEMTRKLAQGERRMAEMQRMQMREQHERKKSRSGQREELEDDDDSNDEGGEETKSEGTKSEKEVIAKFLRAAKELREALPRANEAILKELEETTSMSLNRVRSRREELLREEVDERKKQMESKLCCVCLVQERTTLLLPCKHLVMCARCAGDDRMDCCPICRCDIQDTMEIYS
jgi:hypothetical protein